MAAVSQEQAELAQQLANQIAEAFGVESIAVESTAKGIRLSKLRVHREQGESWDDLINRASDIVGRLRDEFGELV